MLYGTPLFELSCGPRYPTVGPLCCVTGRVVAVATCTRAAGPTGACLLQLLLLCTIHGAIDIEFVCGS